LPEPKGRPPRTAIEPEAWELFKSDYLRLEQPDAAACYRRLQRIAAVRPSWAPLPSLDTFERRIAGIAHPVRVLTREGEGALMRTRPAQQRDRSGMAAMERVNADGHMFDVAVRFPDGSIGRPVIVGWQDIASGKILGWRLGRMETSELVRLSFADTVRQYGIPAHAHLDNGRAFASKKLTGGMAN